MLLCYEHDDSYINRIGRIEMVTSVQDQLFLNQEKNDKLKEVSARRGRSLDIELANGGLTGVVSPFYMKSGFKHGWESAQAESEGQVVNKSKPSSKVQRLGAVVGSVSGGLIGGAVVAMIALGPAGGIAVATAAAIIGGSLAVGGLLGYVDGYFEKQKIKVEENNGRSQFKEALKDLNQNKQIETQQNRLNSLEQKLGIMTSQNYSQYNVTQPPAQNNLPNNMQSNGMFR